MGLNIKNQRVHDLAKEAARRTGRSQTSVIELALGRLLSEIDEDGRQARRDRARALAADMQARVRAAGGELSTDDLYDEAGLPR